MAESIKWDDQYSVGVKLIDEQHQQLMVLTNALYEACNHGGEEMNSKFKMAARMAVEYVVVHFSTEEELMEKINYPDMEAHKREHKKFAKTVLDTVKQFEEGGIYAPHAFVRFLRNWIFQHIALVDKRLGTYYMQAEEEKKALV